MNAGGGRLDALAARSRGPVSAEDTGNTTEDPAASEEIIIPSAMLYYRMSDPVVRVDAGQVDPEAIHSAQQEADMPDQNEGDVNRETIRGMLCPTGLVYYDEESISHLDKYFSKKSDVIPVTRASKGGYTAASRLMDGEKFRQLVDEAGKALCETAVHILDGDVSAQPAVIDKKRTACDYCPYREACGFDPRIPGYSFRKN